jgi:hypothetical protein
VISSASIQEIEVELFGRDHIGLKSCSTYQPEYCFYGCGPDVDYVDPVAPGGLAS